MTKSKLRGVMNNNDRICSAFKINGFKIINYIYARDYTIYYVSKDYAKKFNIDFNGKITLEVKVNFNFFKCLMPYFYPNFKEISNIIPKNIDNHIYPNGNICYAPPSRPVNEKWRFIDFVNAVDSMINNYFSKEYIGTSTLTELEHGLKGLKKYDNLISKKSSKI